MDPQVFNIVAKVHRLLNEESELDTATRAYISGLLEGVLEVYGEPNPAIQVPIKSPMREPWYRKFLP